jgi:dual specificity phosphatase 12
MPLSLSAAKSVDLRRGITHLVSVCPDYPPQGPNHLTIPVQDSEYDDILIHLSVACRFIQSALDSGGRVLVHCHMGISRSATVIAAYCEILIPQERLKAYSKLTMH